MDTLDIILFSIGILALIDFILSILGFPIVTNIIDYMKERKEKK